MLKMFVPVIAKELGTVHGHVPFFLRRLCDLEPSGEADCDALPRWRMKRMHSVDIQIMLESGQLSSKIGFLRRQNLLEILQDGSRNQR